MAAQDTRAHGRKKLEEEIKRRGGQPLFHYEGQRERVLVRSPRGEVSARFSVRSAGDWQTNVTEGDETAADESGRVWVFVDLPDKEPARFYIAPEGFIRRDIAADYAAFLAAHHGQRPKNPRAKRAADPNPPRPAVA